MKFSEQVVLGSTLVKFSSVVFLQDGCGCLIGMAGAATGETYMGGRHATYRVEQKFPWLSKARLVRCPVCMVTHECYAGSISCMAAHVEYDECTFDQALAYIRSIEPPEDECDSPDQVIPVWNRYQAVNV
jgi:hypothetical protein